ncbi:MAG: hypothetical protein IPP72_21185 [Chitinophagaceae bacterium]|nr:hypothetical protein [Chitinophagaceae bacterium]
MAPHTDNMIWGVSDSTFVYLSYDNLRKCNIARQTNQYSFTMKVHPASVISYAEIKR